ncbi:MAG: Aspartyl-tRNA(Asn) amidotransferase subunit Glutamyl-tRNA(Gln) amidotransferase subunit [Betaproteobacteria bacterium]|nr:Aspartyl-tRNA(Asn) amidotransferase subunit Glutamyl-tRNA(Gln) amidotransferase subunit [Betaproteobacteria bacterium]
MGVGSFCDNPRSHSSFIISHSKQMSSLNRLTAAEAARQIAAGKITSEALVRDCLDRIAERDGEVHAWVHCDADAALAQARAVDKSPGKGPLRGVPVAFKDVIDTFDMPTQYNSAIYRGYRPRIDAACVALVRHAGGVVLGKTVTTEFATRTAGPTRNPHNLEHTPGGSSSGSAAGVADFMVPLAFGTQTGGSNIRPAAYCGIVGYKPSFGTINRSGLKSLAESLDTIGVMARTVEDCALLATAVSSRALPDLMTKLARAPRVGLCRTSRWQSASAATHAALESAATLLAQGGAQVRDFELPADFDRLYAEQELIMNFEGARALAHERRTAPELMSTYLRQTTQEHWDMPRSRYDDAMRHARECRHVFDGLFTDVDVLLTPSAPDVAPRGLESTGSSLFNRNWTLLGAPCVTVPFGRGEHGLPLGIQIVGRYDDDARVLQAAEWVRQMVG